MELYDPYQGFEKFTLNNDLDVYVLHRPGRSWVASGFVVHSGAAQDPIELGGVAHFVEHLICKNSELPEQQLVDFFRALGGNVSLGTTFFDATNYRFFIPAEEKVFQQSCDYFGRMLFTTCLTKEIEGERNIIVQEFRNRYRHDYEFEFAAELARRCRLGVPGTFPVTPLGSLRSIQQIEWRDLQRFFLRWYTPANVSMVVVGGFTAAEVETLLRDTKLSLVKPGVRNQPPILRKHIPEPKNCLVEMDVGKFTSDPSQFTNYSCFYNLPAEMIRNGLTTIARGVVYRLWFEEFRLQRNWSYLTPVSWMFFDGYGVLSVSASSMPGEVKEQAVMLGKEIISSLPHHADLFSRYQTEKIRGLYLEDCNDSQLLESTMEDLRSWRKIITLTEMREDYLGLSADDWNSICQYLTPTRGVVGLTFK